MAEIFNGIFQSMRNYITKIFLISNAIFMLRSETFQTILVIRSSVKDQRSRKQIRGSHEDLFRSDGIQWDINQIYKCIVYCKVCCVLAKRDVDFFSWKELDDKILFLL